MYEYYNLVSLHSDVVQMTEVRYAKDQDEPSPTVTNGHHQQLSNGRQKPQSCHHYKTLLLHCKTAKNKVKYYKQYSHTKFYCFPNNFLSGPLINRITYIYLSDYITIMPGLPGWHCHSTILSLNCYNV